MYVRAALSRAGAGLRRATSARLLLRLRPVITLRATGQPRRGAGERVRGRGQRRAAQARGCAGAAAARARPLPQGRHAAPCGRARGRFETSFVPAFRARYRYAVVARSDDVDTDRGSTGWQPLRVR